MKLVIAILALSTVAAFAADTPPALSTGDQIAIRALEKQKQEAQTEFTQALTAEQTIAKEFEKSHPGWKLNPSTFAVEKEEPAKPEAKK